MDSVRGHNKARQAVSSSIRTGSANPAPPSRKPPSFRPPHFNCRTTSTDGKPIGMAMLRTFLGPTGACSRSIEILHPFIDGNGRLGRMIIPLFLFKNKILSRPCFYLSAFFEARRDDYISRLRELGQPGSGPVGLHSSSRASPPRPRPTLTKPAPSRTYTNALKNRSSNSLIPNSPSRSSTSCSSAPSSAPATSPNLRTAQRPHGRHPPGPAQTAASSTPSEAALAAAPRSLPSPN